MIAILDNLRSIHNTASIFRTSDGVGISKLYLCGTTPTPIDKWGRKLSSFAKVSLNSEDNVKWKYFKSTNEAIQKAKKDGYEIVALEQNSKSKNIFEFTSKSEIALVVGPEVAGISKTTLDLCDTILEIPMNGQKESLNVSVAFGIAVYTLNNQYDN